MFAPKVLRYFKPTCGEVPLEHESDREVEEHVGKRSDPADPKKLPTNHFKSIGVSENPACQWIG